MQRPALSSTLLVLFLASLGAALGACGGSIVPGERSENEPGPGPTSPPPSVSANPYQPPTGVSPAPVADPVATPLAPLPPLPAVDAPPPGGEAEHLQWMKSSIVGTWRGVATTPWTPPYGVEITFAADLHYSAHCVAPTDSSCRAFYYGVDTDAPARVYDLVDVLANRRGVGSIYVWPDAGSWTGDLKGVTFYGNASRLTFDFSHESRSAIRYDLVRVP